MEPIDLILVGCGLMGGRHLRGYAALEAVRPGSLRLRAVCDPQPAAAERVAAEAEGLLGYRPAIASIVERLEEQLVKRCLPRALEVAADGSVPCKLVEVRPQSSGCSCDSAGP